MIEVEGVISDEEIIKAIDKNFNSIDVIREINGEIAMNLRFGSFLIMSRYYKTNGTIFRKSITTYSFTIRKDNLLFLVKDAKMLTEYLYQKYISLHSEDHLSEFKKAAKTND